MEAGFTVRWGKNDQIRYFEARINPPLNFLRPRPPVFSDRLKALIGEINDYKAKTVSGLAGYETITMYDAVASYKSPAYSSEEIAYLLVNWMDPGPVSGSYAPSLYLGLSAGMGVKAADLPEILSLWERLLEGVTRVEMAE